MNKGFIHILLLAILALAGFMVLSTVIEDGREPSNQTDQINR